jgi:hypothetical protein
MSCVLPPNLLPNARPFSKKNDRVLQSFLETLACKGRNSVLLLTELGKRSLAQYIVFKCLNPIREGR